MNFDLCFRLHDCCSVKEEDLIRMELNRIRMFAANLQNQLKAERERVLFFQRKCETLEKTTEARVKEATEKYRLENDDLRLTVTRERKRADKAEADKKKAEYQAYECERRALDAEKKLQEKEDDNKILNVKLEEFKNIKEYADKANLTDVDIKAVVTAIQRKTYCRSSEGTRFLDDEIDPERPALMDMDLDDLDRELLGNVKSTDASDKEDSKKAVKASDNKQNKKQKTKTATQDKSEKKGFSKRKHVFNAPEIRHECDMLIPKNARLLKRHNTESGEDVWEVEVYTYEPARVIKHIYKVGRITIPGEGLFTIGHPGCIIKRNPLHPSFARFYLDSKFGYNLSENRILEMLDEMNAPLSQSNLNRWMHQIMSYLRKQLEPLMIEAIKLSFETYNDETRLLVRSYVEEYDRLKYNIEYVHACLSLEAKLVAMIYEKGSRSHEVQEEAFFRGSNIKLFMADRAPLYKTIVKDLKEQQIIRAACWVHLRRRLVDAYLSDPRVRDLIVWINALFKIERYSKEQGHTPHQRFLCRQRHSQQYVDKIIEKAKEMRLAGNEYGSMVHRALNYLLDDEEAFKVFLTHGEIDLSNNLIENLFRHIATGRRNWLHTGSHVAAQNIAFMYSLYESCKLNEIKFGEYIEDILTRFMKGEKADASFLPNKWTKCPETSTQTA